MRRHAKPWERMLSCSRKSLAVGEKKGLLMQELLAAKFFLARYINPHHPTPSSLHNTAASLILVYTSD